MKVLTFRDLRPLKGIPYSRQHVDRKVRAGTFPKPIKLGEGQRATNAWLESEIDKWLQRRAASRKAASPQAALNPTS
jgi:prophage regulatory protein